MEPISAAIVAGLANLAQPAIKDAYNALKSVLTRKFGKGHDVVEALDTLEKHPTSEGRAATLNEEVVKSGVQSDPEILKAVQALIDSIKAQPGTQKIIQNITGNSNIVAGRDANVNYGPKK
jgi:hypothetical protein